MAKKPDWIGIYPAVTTAFSKDLSVDLAGVEKSIGQLIDDGVHGLVMLGTVGENTSLSPEEKRSVIECAVKTADSRVPVIAGVAEYTTAGAVRYARDCERLGVDGLMVLPAMVYKADEREALAHFRTVAEATNLPNILYNNPAVYGLDLTPEMVRDLARIDNIEAIKESSEDPRRITDLTNLCGDDIVLMAGVDDVAFECLLLGAQGWVAGFANVFPEESVKLFELARAGRVEEALTIYRWLMPCLHFDTHPKLVQMIKLAEAIAGRGDERVRPPRLELSGEEREQVTGVIEKCLGTRPAMPAT